MPIILPPTPDELIQLEAALIACRGLAKEFRQIVYRCASVARANASDLLSGIGSELHGNRWNPRGIRTVYASLGHATAVEEMVQSKVANGLPISEATPFILTAIETSLDRVVDLTDPQVLSLLKTLGLTTDRMVDEPWRRRIDSNGAEPGWTTELGRFAHRQEYQGLIVPSKPHPGGKNLVIFPDHAGAGDLRIVNERDLPG